MLVPDPERVQPELSDAPWAPRGAFLASQDSNSDFQIFNFTTPSSLPLLTPTQTAARYPQISATMASSTPGDAPFDSANAPPAIVCIGMAGKSSSMLPTFLDNSNIFF